MLATVITAEVSMRVCSKCGEAKLTVDFAAPRSRVCDTCRRGASREAHIRWKTANPERFKESKRAHRERNAERIRERNRLAAQRARQANPEQARERDREKYARADKTKRNAAARARRKADPEHQRVLTRAQQERWKARHPDYRERGLEYQRRWSAENRDKKKAYRYAWRQKDLGYAREIERQAARRRRARKAGADCRVILDRDLRRQLHRQGFACFYCGAKKPLHHEHIIPLVRGGRDSIGNLVFACGFCNSSKHDALLAEWRQRVGHLLAARSAI